jgi:alcohol dehydrogenase (cytochrome c)
MALLTAVTLAAASTSIGAAQPASASVGTAEQLEAGRTAYRTHCATCHAGDLGGRGETPPLAGDGFLQAWKSKTTADFYQYIQGMPPEGPKPSADEYLTIVVFVLERNGGPIGPTALTPTATTSIGAVATGRPAAR